MQLYIIRHCQSENNALWQRTGAEIGRSSDPGLSELGHKQAQRLAEYLKEALTEYGEENSTGYWSAPGGFTHLYCSLMLRSIQTGTYISEALDLPLVGLENIHERVAGHSASARSGIYLRNSETDRNEGLPGPNRDLFLARHPNIILPDSIGAEGWWNRPYEESEEAIHRARDFFNWLEGKHGSTNDRIAIICHGGFMQSLFSVLLNGSLTYENGHSKREIWIKINNGSITRLDFWDEGVRLNYLKRFACHFSSLLSCQLSNFSADGRFFPFPFPGDSKDSPGSKILISTSGAIFCAYF